MDGTLATHQAGQLLTKKYDKLELPGRLIAEKLFELAKIILNGHAEFIEASLPLRLSRCNEAVEMLRQADAR